MKEGACVIFTHANIFCNNPRNGWLAVQGGIFFHHEKRNGWIKGVPPPGGAFLIRWTSICPKHELVGGWFTLWKIWKSIGMISNPIYGKNKKWQPNHQPVITFSKLNLSKTYLEAKKTDLKRTPLYWKFARIHAFKCPLRHDDHPTFKQDLDTPKIKHNPK